jgi:dTMP kinase
MFITLEGVEGAGKTSQVQNVIAFFRGKGYECVTTREPGGTPIGEQIRAILLDSANSDLDSGTELLLYLADRVQHIQSSIKPNLEAGRVVICDRYMDATLVYQGYARGLGMDLIHQLHQLMCPDVQPDLTLLFDLDPKVGLSRAWRRIADQEEAEDESRFEQETLDFHQKVRKGYLVLAHKEPQRIKVIDALPDKEHIARQIQGVLTEYVSEK